MVITSELAHSLLEYRGGELIWKPRGIPRWDKVNAGKVITYKSGPYIYASIHGKRHAVHRLIWLMFNGEMPRSQIDHINRDTVDNRIENLREATHVQNSGNTGVWKTNTSGYRGVGFHKATGKWRAYISNGDVHKSLGYYKCPKEAATAYNRAAVEYFGEFATLNHIK